MKVGRVAEGTLLFLLVVVGGACTQPAEPTPIATPTTPAPSPTPTSLPLTTEQIIQRSVERFAQVISYRAELTGTIPDTQIPFTRERAAVHVGKAAATTQEILNPETGQEIFQFHMLCIGSVHYSRSNIPDSRWRIVEEELKYFPAGHGLLALAMGDDFQGDHCEPVPLFAGLKQMGATFQQTTDPDFEHGEAYKVSFEVDPERMKELWLLKMGERGVEMPEAEHLAKNALFSMSGTVWITKADFLIRKEDFIFELPPLFESNPSYRVQSQFMEYDKPVSIEAPSPDEVLPSPSILTPTPTPTPAPTPSPTATPPIDADTEFQIVVTAVSAMMVDNSMASALTTLPDPWDGVGENDTDSNCTTGTDNMDEFPDVNTVVATKETYLGGTSGASDKAGFILFGHDITMDGVATGLVNYVTTQTSFFCYIVAFDGTVTQYDHSGSQINP